MKVTIITAFYKGTQYISGLFKMMKQNVDNCKSKGIPVSLEYIIVNDSPEIFIDETNPYFNDFSLRVINNEKNVGIHMTRVIGINHATGDYIIMFDQDDILLSNALSSSIERIGKADILISNGYNVYSDDEMIPIYKNYFSQMLAGRIIFYECVSSLIVSPGHILLKKSSIPEVWKKEIMKKNGSDDFFLWLLLFQNRVKVAFNRECVYKHIDTNINLSRDRKKMYESSENFCLIAKEKQLFKKSILNKITRRTELKIAWNFSELNRNRRIFLAIKNIDIMMINMVYRFFY